MSHLTDGQLHAYLDGSVEALEGATLAEARSHLAACEDCGARLEAARLMRDEAASLLGTATPSSFSPPPFEELERRAARQDPVHDPAGESTAPARSTSAGGAVGGRLLRRPGSLAWAASLTIALTAGWLARGMVGPGMADRRALVAPAESIALQEKQEVSALARSADRDAADRVAAESLERSVFSGEEAGEGASGRMALPSVESPSEPKEGRDARSTPSAEFFSREAGELEEEDGAYRQRSDVAALDAMDEAATETAGEEAAPTDDRPAPVTEELEARRFDMGNREQVARLEAQRAESESQRAAAKMVGPDVAGRRSGGVGAAEAPAEWQPVRREQAEALLGGALKTVEGLPVLSVYARAADAAPEVWTAQQLASGHQLNLRQTPLGDDEFGDLEEGRAANEPGEPAADPVREAPEVQARPGQQQQAYYETLESLLVDGFLIEARAPLSPDSLRVLLSRLKD